MTKSRSLLTLLLACLLSPLSAATQTDYGTAGQALPWLRFENNARSSALAGLAGAFDGDINNLTVNPASLGGLKSQNLALMHDQAAGGTLIERLAYGVGLGGYGLGISLDYVNFGSVDSYVVDSGTGQLIKGKSVTPSAYDMALGYGQAWGSLAAGLSLKLAAENLGSAAQGGFAVDLGGRWQAHPHAALALSAQNLGPQVNGVNLPMALRASVLGSWNLAEMAAPAPAPAPKKKDWRNKGTQAKPLAEMENPNPVAPAPRQDLNVGLELTAPFADTRAILAGLGLEYRYDGRYALRGGYKLGGPASPSGPCAGAGLSFGRVTLDYAWDLNATFGNSHRVSALVEF